MSKLKPGSLTGLSGDGVGGAVLNEENKGPASELSLLRSHCYCLRQRGN